MKFGSINVVRATNDPASVPTAAASAQPNCNVRPMWIPSSWEDSRLDDTARNAKPIFVLRSSSVTKKTAARILAESREQEVIVREAYLLILNRVPLAEESKDAATFLEAFGGRADSSAAVAALCQTLFASAEFLYLY